ncbi:hypothetical protein AAF712_016074 [Marasmius tenuissimus]|uniref:Helicase ATP-binding domain-containing protein n=1 Tax=Marasmius tenuissimus TaxID=585030 RepID=A0ABR2Z7S8_9AGAR
MTTEGCQTVADYVEDVLTMQNTPLLQIIERYDIPANPYYPHTYITSLSGKNLTTALRTIVIAFHITNGREIPREHQLRFVVNSINHDSALIAGTGSGKTLAVALLVHLASRHRITITISPLKRPQITHARDFLEKYKIPTLVVNEDTPRGVYYWKGIDFPDVDIVINVNIPPTGADALQRGGRAKRQLMTFGFFLILYEEWVSKVDLDEFEENRAAFGDDPDRPRQKLTDKLP